MIDFLADLFGDWRGKASLTGLCAYTQRYPAFTKENMSNATVIFQKMTICCSLKKYGNEQGRKILLSQISRLTCPSATA